MDLGSVAAAAVMTGVTAATAGDQNDGKNDQPNPVIVEKIAKAVVHGCSSLRIREYGGLLPSSVIRI